MFILPQLNKVAPWYSGSTMDCCFINLGFISTSACWEVLMIRLPDDGPFWKYGCWLLVGQPSHKKQFIIIIKVSRMKCSEFQFRITAPECHIQKIRSIRSFKVKNRNIFRYTHNSIAIAIVWNTHFIIFSFRAGLISGRNFLKPTYHSFPRLSEYLDYEV